MKRFEHQIIDVTNTTGWFAMIVQMMQETGWEMVQVYTNEQGNKNLIMKREVTK